MLQSGCTPSPLTVSISASPVSIASWPCLATRSPGITASPIRPRCEAWCGVRCALHPAHPPRMRRSPREFEGPCLRSSKAEECRTSARKPAGRSDSDLIFHVVNEYTVCHALHAVLTIFSNPCASYFQKSCREIRSHPAGPHVREPCGRRPASQVPVVARLSISGRHRLCCGVSGLTAGANRSALRGRCRLHAR